MSSCTRIQSAAVAGMRAFSSRRHLLALSGATAIIMAGAIAPAQATSIEEAVRFALQTNPEIGIAAENKRAVELELEQAEGQLLPVIDVSAQAGYQATRDRISFGRAEGGEGSFGMPVYSSRLSLTQLLFDGRATDADIARQESRVVSASRRVRETSEFLGLDAVEAYLDSLRQRELSAIAQDNVRQHRLTLELVEQKAAGGAATTADVQQAESRLAAAEATLTEVNARLRDADFTYARVIGEEPKDLVRPSAPAWALPNTLEDAVALALRNNPTAAVTRADMETTRQEYRIAKGALWPTFELELNGNAARNEDAVRGADLNAAALLRVTYNIYRGGRDTNRIHELVHRIGETRQIHNRALRLTEEEMRISWNALVSARDRLTSQRREVDANNRVRQTYRQQFDVGGRNLLELLDAENEYFLARGNLVSTEFLEVFSIYRILATGGTLISALEVPQAGDGRTDLDPIRPEVADHQGRFLGETVPSRAPGGQMTTPTPPVAAPTPPVGVIDPSAPLDPLAPRVPQGSRAPLDPLAPVESLDPNAVLPKSSTDMAVATPPPARQETARLGNSNLSISSGEFTQQGVAPPATATPVVVEVTTRQRDVVAGDLSRALAATPYGMFD